MKNVVRCLTVLLVSILSPGIFSVHASTNGMLAPYYRGQTNTQASGWEVFTVAAGAPGNHPDAPGTSTNAVLIQTDTNAFITGTGNIYSFSNATVFNIADNPPFGAGEVFFQARTVGTEIAYGSVQLRYDLGNGPQYLTVPRVENLRESSSAGTAVVSQWIWHIAGLGISNYHIEFQAAGPSMSFDSAFLDTVVASNHVLTNPVVDRWMYPHNPDPAGRTTASVFGTFGDASGVDTRFGQHLLGFDTSSLFATNRGATNYLVRHARVIMTINRDQSFRYDPTQDDFLTYFETNHPAYQPDGDTGRPIEMFGAGFRNGFTAQTFLQDSAFGGGGPGERNVYAAGWDTNGALVDVGNNVGKTNAAFPRFEVHPFAIGRTATVVPGALVPQATKFTFELNLADPLVRQYVQEALDTGRLSLMITALHDSSFGGLPVWPDFFTHFSTLGDGPVLDIEAAVVEAGDLDVDGLPDEWERFHFSSLNQTAVKDPDNDGQSNLAEYKAGTSPIEVLDVLKVVGLNRDTNGALVRFNFAASRDYAVEYSRDLQNWSSIENPTLLYYMAPGVVELFDDGSQTGGLSTNRYYRVRLK